MISDNSPAKIAVVDDHLAICRALVHLLRSHGFAASRWRSGQAFLDGADLDALSCVVLELRLPDLTGLEIQERLRASGRSCPIIFFTDESDAASAARAQNAGAFAFLEKPRDLPLLIDVIRRACDGQLAVSPFPG